LLPKIQKALHLYTKVISLSSELTTKLLFPSNLFGASTEANHLHTIYIVGSLGKISARSCLPLRLKPFAFFAFKSLYRSSHVMLEILKFRKCWFRQNFAHFFNFAASNTILC
jgi:hypothetical protein